MSEAHIKSILEESKTVAVVGLSPREERDSHRVAKYLQSQGYRIIPVNPNADEILGERSYSDLGSVPEPIDVVDVFRRSEAMPEIVVTDVVLHEGRSIGDDVVEGGGDFRPGGCAACEQEGPTWPFNALSQSSNPMPRAAT